MTGVLSRDENRHRRKIIGGHGEKTDIGKPNREVTEENNLADTLISDFGVQHCEAIRFCCLSHPVCAFVVTALGNSYARFLCPELKCGEVVQTYLACCLPEGQLRDQDIILSVVAASNSIPLLSGKPSFSISYSLFSIFCITLKEVSSKVLFLDIVQSREIQ